MIQKKGIVQQRWKIVQDEIVGEEFVAGISPDITTPKPNLNQSNSPVAPLVLDWRSALERQDVTAYTNLWDKSARKKRATSFRLAVGLLSQMHIIDIEQATYSPVPTQRNRYIVDQISVTLQNGADIIETQNRTLTIEKKGFFRRKWKLINDQIGQESGPVAPPQTEPSDPGEKSDGTDGDAPLDTKFKVKQILGKWQVAWEEKDLNTYMSIYSDKALITRVTVRGGKETPIYLNKKQLLDKMKKVNEMYADIEVGISNLQVNGDRAVADATFLQKFTGTPADGTRPAYSDIGTKRLTLMIDPADGHWRIYAETWSLYEEVPEFPKM